MSDFIDRLVESRKQGDYMYQKGRADAYAEVDKLIAEMTEIAESQRMFRHAEICELIRERIKVICNGR